MKASKRLVKAFKKLFKGDQKEPRAEPEGGTALSDSRSYEALKGLIVPSKAL